MKYDIAVIGAGPAGMMAAGKAADKGTKVVLIEKNNRFGKKLLLTGKGRCNITNSDFDARSFVNEFGKNGKFLFSALHKFGPEDTIKFFNERGLPTKIERGNRVFPKSDRSNDVLRVLENFLRETGVKIMKGTEVKSFIKKDQLIAGVKTSSGEIIADKYILCTGGLSYPATGSTGDGFKWLKQMGHTVIPPKPALVPVILKEKWIKELEGLSLKNVKISIYQNNKKQIEQFGEALFTHNGLSGPIILEMSKRIGELLKTELVKLAIDFKPALEFETLDKRIQRDIQENSAKMFKNSLDWLLPQKLIPVVVKLSGIKPEKKAGELTRKERRKLLHLLKEFELEVVGLANIDEAIITVGGVSLKEVDPQTMQSKLFSNLYFAGEILDLDGPTGGYNLQVCWTTGSVAGQSAAVKN